MKPILDRKILNDKFIKKIENYIKRKCRFKIYFFTNTILRLLTLLRHANSLNLEKNKNIKFKKKTKSVKFTERLNLFIFEISKKYEKY